MKKYIITITCLIFSGIAFSVYSMENTDMLMNITNNPITITQSRYQNNGEYISRLTELLQNVDQWLFVYSPEKNKYIPNLSPLEKLIYDAENEREIKPIQDYGVQVKKQKIEFQDKEEKELSYTMPTEYCPIISPEEEVEISRLSKTIETYKRPEYDERPNIYRANPQYSDELHKKLKDTFKNYDIRKLEILLQYGESDFFSYVVSPFLKDFLRKKESALVSVLDDCKYIIDDSTSWEAIYNRYVQNESQEDKQDFNLYKKILDLLRSRSVLYDSFLRDAVEFFMKDGFGAKNGFYKAIIHDAFQHFPRGTAINIIHLAESAKLSKEGRRALSIIKAYDNNLLQTMIDSNANILEIAAHEENLLKLLLDQGVEFKPKQLELILEANNLVSICCLLSKKPFSLKDEPISNWFYENVAYPKFFDFNSVTKCEGIVDYTSQAIIVNSPIDQYGYAKKVCIPLLEALHTGNITIAEEFVLQNRPSQKIFILKEINEISSKIAQEDKDILNQIDQICQDPNCNLHAYAEEQIEKINKFVEKYTKILQNSPNFLDCLLTKIKNINEKENKQISNKVNAQPAFCWPSIGIGPSAYFLHQSSREGNFNVWTTLFAAGTLAWSGWKTYAYYNNYQQLTRAMHLQEKTNKLEGYLTSLQNKAELVGRNSQDEQNKENTVSVRQWPKIGSKIWAPLAFGCFAPVIPAICKTTFKTGTHVEVANNKSTSGFLSKIANGLGFSAVSAWLWRQNKNKFEFDDAQNLFMSWRNRGEADGFAKIQEFKKNGNADNNALLKLTARNET